MTVALRMSSLYAPTLKEEPSEADIASHRVLLRAGMVRKSAAGVYTFLPLGWRSLRKIEQIVREEMDAIGSQEMLMPVIQPAEIWQQSKRWEAYGPELMRVTDRHGREFALGPTHEEIITTVVKGELRSYRDLPVSLYQIQVKFRDEVRPRFGLLRGREFIMKDAYSFHADQASLQQHYDAMSGAYARICERLGLAFRPVEADSGQIGGKVTIEFMALAEAGEAEIVYCSGCDYAADVEAAATVVPRHPAVTEPVTMERVHTPGIRTIAEVASFLQVEEHDTTKTMAGLAPDGRLVFFCVPGDRELNPVKADRAVPGVRLLEEEEFAARDLPKGSLGPVGAGEKWGALVVADRSLEASVSWAVGANDNDYHLVGAMPGRDFAVDEWSDLVVALAGDACPACGGTLMGARGIEVSQVFQLGTKYSESLGATFTDEDGGEKPFVMGSYGVGISRSLAAVAEQYADEAGCAWPATVAPLEVAVIPLSEDDQVASVAELLFADLANRGVEVVIDDRDERAGVKFADADLVGWPYQVVVGKRGVAEGVVEIKHRRTGERESVPIAEAAERVAALVAQAKELLRAKTTAGLPEAD
jgi:prolyl-tRNA synthetase